MDGQGCPIHGNFAFIRLVGAAQHLDECALAGPVLTEDGMHRAGPDRQVRTGVGHHSGKALPDPTQLDRRLDAIVDASMFPEELSDPRRGVLTTGRDRTSGQVVFQRGFQLPPLPPGTETAFVNGVEYRVRTVPVEQDGGLLMSIGIRADSVLLNRARIPLYIAVGVVTVLIAAGLGWLLAGPAIRPLRKLTENTKRLGKDAEDIPAVHGVREAEEDALLRLVSNLLGINDMESARARQRVEGRS